MTHAIDISQLSPAECILLAEELWERVRNQPDTVVLSDIQLAELNSRVDAFENGELPPGEPWDDVDAWLGTL